MKISIRKKTSGQAMTEMLVFLPLLALLIMMIMWIGNIMINWAFITQGARWGSDLIQFRNYGYNPGEGTAAASPKKIKEGIQGFLGVSGGKHGRRLKAANLSIHIVDSGGADQTSASPIFANYPNVKNNSAGSIAGVTSMSTIGVEVYYKVEVAPIIPGGTVEVGSRCEIISLGCGYVPLSLE